MAYRAQNKSQCQRDPSVFHCFLTCVLNRNQLTKRGHRTISKCSQVWDHDKRYYSCADIAVPALFQHSTFLLRPMSAHACTWNRINCRPTCNPSPNGNQAIFCTHISIEWKMGCAEPILTSENEPKETKQWDAVILFDCQIHLTSSSLLQIFNCSSRFFEYDCGRIVFMA